MNTESYKMYKKAKEFGKKITSDAKYKAQDDLYNKLGQRGEIFSSFQE